VWGRAFSPPVPAEAGTHVTHSSYIRSSRSRASWRSRWRMKIFWHHVWGRAFSPPLEFGHFRYG